MHRLFQQPVKAAFVINRRIVGTVIGRDVRSALAEYPLAVLGSTVSQRILFPESAAMGQLVNEIDLKSAAAREIAGFVSDVRLLMS